jgi:hypothetical protein
VRTSNILALQAQKPIPAALDFDNAALKTELWREMGHLNHEQRLALATKFRRWAEQLETFVVQLRAIEQLNTPGGLIRN